MESSRIYRTEGRVVSNPQKQRSTLQIDAARRRAIHSALIKGGYSIKRQAMTKRYFL
jgi:hypothetical protein